MSLNLIPPNDFAASEETATEYLHSVLDGAVANGRHASTARRPQAAVGMLASPALGPLLGPLMVAVSAQGIVLIHFLHQEPDFANALGRLRRRFDPVIDHKAVAIVGQELRRFMSGDETALRSKPDLSLVNGAFQRKVLDRLLQVGRGSTVTYSWLAAAVKAPGAARAVGTAMHDNPIPIYVPCHRVVRSDLSLGGYGGGLELKRRLLELEGIAFDAKGRLARASGE